MGIMTSAHEKDPNATHIERPVIIQRARRQYKENRDLFLKEGLTYSAVDKISSLAFLNVWDIYHLFYNVKKIPDKGNYLEIGSCTGGSLLCAYEAVKTTNKTIYLTAIDINCELALVRNTNHLSNLTLIKSHSDLAKDKIKNNSIDLLFLDADHDYRQAKKDIANYWPKLKQGGIFMGHDYTIHIPGVIQACKESFQKVTLLPRSSTFFVRKRNE